MDSVLILNKVLKSFNEFSKNASLPEGLFTLPNDVKQSNISSDQLKEALIQLSFDIKTLVEEERKSSALANCVQITASKSQLDQRIAAFQHHARNAVNQQNIQEFFPNKLDTTVQDGCARTHAVYRRRPASRTHVQVSRVKNVEGPQTQIDWQGRWSADSIKREKPRLLNCPESVQERLQNLEQHVGLNRSTAPKDVYARLKVLENRVLQLEAVSPEYFQDVKRQRNERTSSVSNDARQLSLDQIDDRIKFLKQKLLSKRKKLE